MLSVDDWAEIRRLHRAEGLSIRAIARVRGVSRNTVRNALQADGPVLTRIDATSNSAVNRRLACADFQPTRKGSVSFEVPSHRDGPKGHL